MKTQFAIRAAATTALVVGFSLVALAKTGDSEQISINMHQARVHSAQAAADLDVLESYSMSGVPWETYFNRLQHVEDDVNAVIKDYNHLNALRASATPAQIEALNAIRPILQGLQVQVKETLRYVDYHSAAINMPPFVRRVHLEFASANSILSNLCDCAKKNDSVQLASVKVPIAASDCSSKKVTAPVRDAVSFALPSNAAKTGAPTASLR